MNLHHESSLEEGKMYADLLPLRGRETVSNVKMLKLKTG